MNLAWIRPNITIIVAGAILALFVYLIWDRGALKTEVANQKTMIAEDKGTIALLLEANDNFAADSKKNNAALDDLRQRKAEMDRRYQEAVQAADLNDIAHKKIEDDIRSEQIGPDPCVYAHKLLTDHMKGRHP